MKHGGAGKKRGLMIYIRVVYRVGLKKREIGMRQKWVLIKHETQRCEANS